MYEKGPLEHDTLFQIMFYAKLINKHVRILFCCAVLELNEYFDLKCWELSWRGCELRDYPSSEKCVCS